MIPCRTSSPPINCRCPIVRRCRRQSLEQSAWWHHICSFSGRLSKAAQDLPISPIIPARLTDELQRSSQSQDIRPLKKSSVIYNVTKYYDNINIIIEVDSYFDVRGVDVIVSFFVFGKFYSRWIVCSSNKATIIPATYQLFDLIMREIGHQNVFASDKIIYELSLQKNLISIYFVYSKTGIV